MTKTDTPSGQTAVGAASPFDQPYLLLVLATLFWGGNIIAGKFAIGEIDPFGLSVLRWLLALLVILPFAWRSLVADRAEIRRGLLWLAFYGVLGFTSFNALLYSATLFTSGVNVAMIQAAIPVLVMVGNFLIFRVRASALHVVGVALTIYGVVHVATHGAPARLLGLNVNLGDALMLGASLLYALHSLLLRYRPKIDWLSFIAVTSFFATLSAAVYYFAFTGGPDRLVSDAMAMSPRGWLVVIYVALLPSIVAQMSYARGVELIGPNRGSLFINLVPVFGTLLSVLLLGDALETFHVVAAILIVGGIALAEYAARRVTLRP